MLIILSPKGSYFDPYFVPNFKSLGHPSQNPAPDLRYAVSDGSSGNAVGTGAQALSPLGVVAEANLFTKVETHPLPPDAQRADGATAAAFTMQLADECYEVRRR